MWLGFRWFKGCPPKAPPPKAKPKVDPYLPPPPKAPSGEDQGTTSPEFDTPKGSASNSGTSTPKTLPLEQYKELMARFNQLNEAITKVREKKDFFIRMRQCRCLVPYLTIMMPSSKSKIIKDLEKEANKLAETIGLDKDPLL